MRILLIFLSFNYLLCFDSIAQKTELTYLEYLAIVKQHHPMALQAQLIIERGKANLLSARGGFDPKIQADLSQKFFEGKEYYDKKNGALKVPTWFGLEFEAGYERNQGQFLSNENNTPSNGLYFAGISVPIGQGLFIDQRRTDLRKAQAFLEQSEADQILAINDLIFNAGVAYWNWYQAYKNLEIFISALNLAEIRYEAVTQAASFGDRPIIDTVEAIIQLQNRQIALQEAELDMKNKAAELSVYLWQDGTIPLELNDSTIPQNDISLSSDDAFLFSINIKDSLIEVHPKLKSQEAKVNQLEFEQRWKAEQLKPRLNLKYQPITEAINDNPLSEYSSNNYTFGVQFEFPIFLRKERGNLNFTKTILSDSRLELLNAKQQIEVKVNTAINEFETVQSQVQVFSRTTQDYFRLLQGERELFDGGESSLFMINSRELGYINAQIKLNELSVKGQKARLKAYYALGVLPN
tara:strand:- start:2149 stop:3546 length:1398 start_codon:yes stop_codon:yes gene_type:complete